MATSPQFPATPVLGQLILDDSTTSGTLFTCSNANGTYIEKLNIISDGEAVMMTVSITLGGTTTKFIVFDSVPASSVVTMDIAIPQNASIEVSLSSAPTGEVHLTLFGGDY